MDTPTLEAAFIASTDAWFVRKGVYLFDPAMLGHAHGWCLRQVIGALDSHWAETIIVDNTNTTIVEIAPYVAVAEAYGYEVEIHCLPYHKIMKELPQRNKHGVPVATIVKQVQRLESTDPILQSSFPRAKIVYVEAQ